MDPRPERLNGVLEQVPVENVYESADDAFRDAAHFDGVVVASPPSFHVDQCISALDCGLPVLLEKPVSPDLASTQKLGVKVKETGVPLLLGYTYRWWEPLIEVKRMLDSNAVGNLLHVKFVMSAHLADWHPWENYQDFFMASKELGGGALLDESHWLDLMLWFFGMPDKIFAQIDKVSSLEIDTDDNVDMLLEYKNGLKVSVHLDIYGRPHEKYIRFTGEDGTLMWSMDPNRIAVGRGMEEAWENIDYKCERNDMFLEVAREYLTVLNGEELKTCTIDDGVKIMSIIEAARKSSVQGKTLVI